MTDAQPNPAPDAAPPALSEAEAETILQALRRKEGNWVAWGQQCQTLQKAGYTPQQLFEATGFEPIHQNQVIVAAQVFASLQAAVPDAIRQHFAQRGSDVLYEMRVLPQEARVLFATLILEKSLNVDDVRDLAKMVQEFWRLSNVPTGYQKHPGDAIAYQCWKLARQHADLQARSRLIARGLQFAQSSTARQQLEQLLTDFSVVATAKAPRLPLYRLEDVEHLPRILPVVGELPLTLADLKAVPLLEEVAPFNLVRFSGTGSGAWVPVPGWQVVLAAEDPVTVLAQSEHLPTPLPNTQEKVLLVIDRAQRQWRDDSYFLVEAGDRLELQWFAQAPEASLLGQLILVLRPKKILDEDYTRELWQIDE